MTGLIVALALTTLASAATIELRGTESPIVAERVAVEPGGVRVTRAGGVTETIAWDMVRSLTGTDNANEAATMLPIGEDLWRARSRVQRGDTVAARPLFEKHFDRFKGTNSETALVVAEGLVRCRLASDDWMQAVIPALEMARLRKAGVTTNRYAALGSVFDDATLLCPQLAPAWVADDRTKTFGDQIAALTINDLTVARLAGLYVALLHGVEPTDDAKRDDLPSIAMLHAIARLNSNDDAARARAAKELAAAVKSLPPWARAWEQHAIGRTALRSQDKLVQVDGVLALLRVAAQPGVSRRLVRMSLDLAVPALRSLGDVDGAAILERERAALGGPKPTAPTNKTPQRSPSQEPRRSL